jgi:hypothetical protein
LHDLRLHRSFLASMPSSGGSSTSRVKFALVLWSASEQWWAHQFGQRRRSWSCPSRGGNSFRGSGRGGRGGRNSPPSHYRPSNASDDEHATKRLRWGTSHKLNCILAAGDSDSDDPQIPVAHTDTDDDIPDLVTESESSDEETLESSQVAASTHYTRRVPRAPRNLPTIRAAANFLSFAAQQREGTPVDTPGSHSGIAIDDSGGLVSCASENATGVESDAQQEPTLRGSRHLPRSFYPGMSRATDLKSQMWSGTLRACSRAMFYTQPRTVAERAQSPAEYTDQWSTERDPTPPHEEAPPLPTGGEEEAADDEEPEIVRRDPFIPDFRLPGSPISVVGRFSDNESDGDQLPTLVDADPTDSDESNLGDAVTFDDPPALRWHSRLALDVGEGQKQTRCIDSPVRRRGGVK